MKDQIKLSDVLKEGQLLKIGPEDLMKLPNYDFKDEFKEINPEWKKYVFELDGFIGIDVEWKPKSKEEENELLLKFTEGLNKLLSEENNWTFLYPLLLSLDYCTRCQSCSLACHVYLASGKKEIYRPTFRSEILRRVTKKSKFGKKLFGSLDVNKNLILRLAELAYRCNLCRRCAQFCPLGIDNGLITREIRKLYSQELGIAPKALHEKGTVQQLERGSSTGLTSEGFRSIIKFAEEEIFERTGKKIKIPVDEKGSDILLIHNAGDYLSKLENVIAFAIIFEEASLDWTLSSEAFGYDAVNYGIWYDDFQLGKIAFKHLEIARKLEVSRIVIGECGHAHKALISVADRLIFGEYQIPRESCLPILSDLVKKKLNLDPEKNSFPVTLHDPCNIVRLMGIVEPQREILRRICPSFKEMKPNGVYNYCCGGGGGLAIMNSLNFSDFRNKVSSRVKFSQILEAFGDVLHSESKKYVCAPCSNCRATIRDFLDYYKAKDKFKIDCCGLAELIVNSMVDFDGFLE